MAPNGWISVDLGWIWAGYIQDGLLVQMVSPKLYPGSPGVVRIGLFYGTTTTTTNPPPPPPTPPKMHYKSTTLSYVADTFYIQEDE